MSKKLPVGEFKWIKHHAYFTEDFIKKYDEDSDYGYLLEVDVKFLSIYSVVTNTYHFYLNE